MYYSLSMIELVTWTFREKQHSETEDDGRNEWYCVFGEHFSTKKEYKMKKTNLRLETRRRVSRTCSLFVLGVAATY